MLSRTPNPYQEDCALHFEQLQITSFTVQLNYNIPGYIHSQWPYKKYSQQHNETKLLYCKVLSSLLLSITDIRAYFQIKCVNQMEKEDTSVGIMAV